MTGGSQVGGNQVGGNQVGRDQGSRDQGEHPDVILCPGGPMLLRGEHVIEDEDGEEHRTWRPVSAVCRCGASGITPWCDGTHKTLRKRPAR